MSNSNDMPQMYQPDVKAQEPDHKGNQYADSPAGAFGGSTDNNWLNITRDQYGNELIADRPFHQDTTAQDGSWNWDGNQYAGGSGDGPWKGGYGSDYGQSVSTDNGKNPQVERTSVDVSRADRGKES